MKWVRRSKLQAVEADRDALSLALTGLLESNSDLMTANALLRTALAHALSGREDEAWAILGEFQSTRW